MKRLSHSILFALTAATLFACGNDSASKPGTPGDPTPDTTPTPGSNVVSQSYSVSECGGFGAQASTRADSGSGENSGEAAVDQSSAAPAPATVSEYCSAERLSYSYDALKGALTLTNARVMLNCCGEHSVKLVKKAEGSYELREIDAPKMVEVAGQQQPSRCHCMCPFDFELQAEDLPAGAIEITIVREVTDSAAPAAEVFQGKLDLSQAQGTLVVDDVDVLGFCE